MKIEDVVHEEVLKLYKGLEGIDGIITDVTKKIVANGYVINVITRFNAGFLIVMLV